MNLEEHCQHSLKRYGIRGDEIHAWIDEPSRLAGGSHRQFRHDLASLPLAIKMFEAKYGADMVENVFLDHLKADSEEERLKTQQAEQASPKYTWSEDEDTFLAKNYNLTVEQLETCFRGRRTRKDIGARKKYLGTITPKYFKYKRARFAKLSFRLEQGQKLFMNIKVISGKNRDIDFCVGNTKRIGNQMNFEKPLTRLLIEKTVEYTPTYTGIHQFNFSNLFSMWTSKEVEVDFHLENGRTMTFNMEI
jgi:hypothetical protein